jgi:hypothetical protein
MEDQILVEVPLASLKMAKGSTATTQILRIGVGSGIQTVLANSCDWGLDAS